MEYRDKLQNLGITLTRSGKQKCPQCSETRKNKSDPCLSVTYTDEAVLYNCHNCGWSGAVYYREKFTQTKKTYKRPAPPKTTEKLDPLYNYFQKRGISKKTLNAYGVSFNERKEIIFPYIKDGELVNVKYRTNQGGGKKAFRQEKDAEKTLFGMDLVRNSDTLVWVEGEMDVLAFAEQGIASVSIPQGAGEDKLECIENCYDFIQKFDNHIIAVDNDAPGAKLKLNLLNRLDRAKCRIVNWKQYKDANEALIAGEQLQEFLNAAQDIAPEGIVSFYECFDEIYKYNFEQDTDFYNTSWIKFDNIVKLRTGHLMIVTGYPSRGKSTFTDQLLVDLSRRYGLKHLIASFESINATHYNTLAEMYNQQPIWKLVENQQIFGDTFEFIAEHFYRIDIDRLWTVDEIIERAEYAVKKYGVKTLVIDPYNRLNNNYTDREDKYIGSILSKLSMLAKKLDILVIFVAHPKKPDGEKMPNMYSISGSSDWYNMADYGIVVHRERDNSTGKLSNMPLISVQKVKNYFLGNPSGGDFTLRYVVERRVLEDCI